MSANAKKILANLVYYTLIGVMVALVVFFVIMLASRRMELYFQIPYYIICGLLVGVVVFDIICTVMHRNKYISAFILYGITLLTIAMSFVAYGLIATNGVVAINLLGKLISLIALSYAINAFAIIIFAIGEYMVADNQ